MTGGFELGSPAWLLALLLVALVPLQARLTGRRAVAAPAVPDTGGRSLRTVLAPLPGLLRVLGLALVVLALARPQLTRRSVKVESEGLDIVLALDTSGSMNAEDFVVRMQPASRLQVAKGVIAQFVEGRPHDRLGLVLFGEEAFTQVPLTLDHDTLQDLLAQAEIGVAGADGTAVGTAIAVSANRIRELEAPSKVVILLTDGRSNAGRIDPLEAAKAAGALGVRVYTIGVGARQGGPLAALLGDGVDVAGLTAIAEATGGKFFRATDTMSLQEVYATIDALEPSTAEVSQQVDHVELFRWLLGPAAALLALELLLSATVLRRAP